MDAFAEAGIEALLLVPESFIGTTEADLDLVEDFLTQEEAIRMPITVPVEDAAALADDDDDDEPIGAPIAFPEMAPAPAAAAEEVDEWGFSGPITPPAVEEDTFDRPAAPIATVDEDDLFAAPVRKRIVVDEDVFG